MGYCAFGLQAGGARTAGRAETRPTLDDVQPELPLRRVTLWDTPCSRCRLSCSPRLKGPTAYHQDEQTSYPSAVKRPGPQRPDRQHRPKPELSVSKTQTPKAHKTAPLGPEAPPNDDQHATGSENHAATLRGRRGSGPEPGGRVLLRGILARYAYTVRRSTWTGNFILLARHNCLLLAPFVVLRSGDRRGQCREGSVGGILWLGGTRLCVYDLLRGIYSLGDGWGPVFGGTRVSKTSATSWRQGTIGRNWMSTLWNNSSVPIQVCITKGPGGDMKQHWHI